LTQTPVVRGPKAAWSSQVRPLVRRAVVRYRHLGLTPDDVLFAAYPKSGSTWLRFVLAGAMTGDEMGFDTIRSVSPRLGEQRRGPKIVNGAGRLVKSHELPAFFPIGSARPKVIWLVRDGRDVVVSRFHHLRRFENIPDDFDAYFERQLSGNVAYGSWQAHVRQWLDYIATAPSPAAIVHYEAMLERPLETLLEVNETCGLNLRRDALEQAIEANSASRMRSKEAASTMLSADGAKTTPFVRNARSGGWREELPAAACAKFEAVAGRELRELGYPLSSAPAGA
jgi:hypothetical protein